MENKNLINGAWDWNNINEDRWVTPAPVVYPLSTRWKKENKNKILDLGCGLGRNSLYFYEQGFNVTAVDGSLSAIEKFEAICKQKDYKIDVRLCDMHSLSFENSTFDAVFSFHVIYHTDSKGIKKVISEIERVLKPTGELFVTLNSKNNTSYLKNINYKIDENTIIKQVLLQFLRQFYGILLLKLQQKQLLLKLVTKLRIYIHITVLAHQLIQ
jgi:SAM-dependent methyltransferase